MVAGNTLSNNVSVLLGNGAGGFGVAVNYAAGATNAVPMKTFCWTTLFGLLPATMVFVYIGTQIPSLATIAERGVVSMLDYKLLLALIAPSMLTLIIRQIVHRFER